MRRLWSWLRRAFWGYVFLWWDCPVCKQQTMRWHKDVVFHPDEPPCFFHWECHNPACGVRSDIAATPLMDEAARNRGYRDFEDFADRTDPEAP